MHAPQFTKRIARSIAEQPFVFATGLAALIHSTWALATLFTGREPEQFTVNWFAWLIPALLISFSLDVGQIVTSAEIRSGQRTLAKYATFAVFAAATYYLQWTYLSSHIPQLPMGEGVSQHWQGIATSLRDASIWIVPALLPLSTLLYTFSHTAPASNSAAMSAKVDAPAIAIETPAVAILPANTDAQQTQEAPKVAAQKPTANGKGQHTIVCPDCGWEGSGNSQRGAVNALNAHRKHCTGVKASANGHTQEAIAT